MDYRNPYETVNDELSHQNNNISNPYPHNYHSNNSNHPFNNQNHTNRESSQTLPEGTGYNPNPNPVMGIPVNPNQIYGINRPLDAPAEYRGDGYYNPDRIVRRPQARRRRVLIGFISLIIIGGFIIILMRFLAH